MIGAVQIANHDGAAAQGKGRTFAAQLVTYVSADVLWDAGATSDNERPVWALFAGTDEEMRAFRANLQCGRRVSLPHSSGHKRGASELRLEFLRSAGYAYLAQRTPAGVALQVTQADLFRHDPGMVDPAGVAFALLPPLARLAEERATLGAELDVALSRAVSSLARRGGLPAYESARKEAVATLAAAAPYARLFAAFLDRRSRCPLVPTLAFHVQLLGAMLTWRSASLPGERGGEEWGRDTRGRLRVAGLASAKLAEPIVVKATHDDIESIIAAEVAAYYAEGGV